ncbi:polysaccharide biosynthesis tyrosine autokinase [Tateyamaria sp. SN6-1]|uniref:polysaccharide biosynthesis tyrosine autokinase n=1 Tax=Tateyamaria sp. SN6-1 TaxID=3092148 RepID=UPI0039F46082
MQSSSKVVPADAPLGQAVEEDVIDFGRLLATVWQGKWLIALVMALAVAAGGYYAQVVVTPTYRATAVVILETNQEQIVDLQSVVGGLSGETSEVNSEAEVLRARGLMGAVVDQLNLVNDPEFNTALRVPGPVDRIQAQIAALIGRTETPVILPENVAAQRVRDAVTSKLVSAVTVRNVPLSLVFEVTAETQDAYKSARIADAIVAQYVRNQVEVKFDATEQATDWLAGRVRELQDSLQEAEAKVAVFSASTDLVSRDGVVALESDIKELRARIDVAEEARDALRAQAQPQAGLVNRAEQQLAALRSTEVKMAADLYQQGVDMITLQQLTREAEATRDLYEYFLTRFKETSAQQGIQQADSRILAQAMVPLRPSAPRTSLILGMAGMIGLLAGVALVLLRAARKTGFQTARALEQATGQTVLGQIPVLPRGARRRALRYLADKPTSAAAEAYRNMRTSLMLSHVDTPPQVIAVTSSVPGEGKTTNALALAQNYLGLGKRVLFIEGDIRRRALHRHFDHVPHHGIVSVLDGAMTLQEAVFRTAGFDADVLCGEATGKNAADVFSSDRFASLIRDARDAYDVIIIDTPPILVVPDARIIAEVADAVVFTVQWDKTGQAQVEESLRLFGTSGQRVTGLVLSQISQRGMKQSAYGAYAGYGSPYYVN